MMSGTELLCLFLIGSGSTEALGKGFVVRIDIIKLLGVDSGGRPESEGSEEVGVELTEYAEEGNG